MGVRGLVLFDFGGTLDADGSRWSVRFHSAYRAAGGKQTFAAFDVTCDGKPMDVAHSEPLSISCGGPGEHVITVAGR